MNEKFVIKDSTSAARWQPLQLRGGCGLLREDSEDELPLLVRLEAGGHDQVVTGRQLEPPRHLAQVDEWFTVAKIFLKG